MQSRTFSRTLNPPNDSSLTLNASHAAEWTRALCYVVERHATQGGYAVFSWGLNESNRAILSVTIVSYSDQERGVRLGRQILEHMILELIMDRMPSFEISLNYHPAVGGRTASFDIVEIAPSGSLVFIRKPGGNHAAYSISSGGRRLLRY